MFMKEKENKKTWKRRGERREKNLEEEKKRGKKNDEGFSRSGWECSLSF